MVYSVNEFSKTPYSTIPANEIAFTIWMESLQGYMWYENSSSIGVEIGHWEMVHNYEYFL